MSTCIDNRKKKGGSKSEKESVIDTLSANSPLLDEIIDAYCLGVRRGVNDFSDYIKKQIIKNASLVTEKGKKLFDEINKVGECKCAFARIEEINAFKIIYALDADFYHNQSLVSPIYQKSWDMSEDMIAENDIIVSVTFMPFSENINVGRLNSDGYRIVYGELR